MDSYLYKRELYGGIKTNRRLPTRNSIRSSLEKKLISRLGVTATLEVGPRPPGRRVSSRVTTVV